VERAETMEVMAEKENKTKALKEAAARQREKIKGLKYTEAN
jgi:hypothetical protein